MAENKDLTTPEAVNAPEELEEVDGSDILDDELENEGLRPKQSFLKDVFDFLEMLILAACAILLVFTFVARISVVEGPSMNRTLEDGDRLIVSNLFYTPAQGDIVVFQDLDSGRESAIVKRIIATGGQTVVLNYGTVDGVYCVTVTVDGVVLDESAYRYYDPKIDDGRKYRYRGTTTYRVPEDCIFVMGDNTYNSEDSRGDFGYVKKDKILGRVIFRLMGDDFSDFFTKFNVVK